MALGDPLQWIIIGVIVIVIFLWGPQKIPDLAKALGRAKREFDDASHEMSSSIAGVGSTASTTAPGARPATPDVSADQALLAAARGLGITTAGKTRAQISQEIVAKGKPQA